jgi:uncharacterized protein (DUF1015 family)
MDFRDERGGARHTTGVLGALELSRPGEGGILPHEHTTRKAKSDRLNLLRSTAANLSAVWGLSPAAGLSALLETGEAPEASWTDDDGVTHSFGIVDDAGRRDKIAEAVGSAPVVIADGHHRYETSLAYQREVGAGGPADFVLMALVSLEDPGLAVFPTHRLVSGLADDTAKQEALGAGLKELFEIEEVPTDQIDPGGVEGVGVFGYIDSHFKRGFRLRLRDTEPLDRALESRSEAYRTLDAAILEELVLKGILGMSTEDIAAKRGIGYTPSIDEALAKLDAGDYQAAFLLRPTPIDQVREVAAAGETMPPKSTYFFPKLLTGLVFNPLT